MFSRFRAEAPSQFSVTAVALPADAVDYGELAAGVAGGLPEGEPVVLVAEWFSGPLAAALAPRLATVATVLCNSFVGAPRSRALRLLIRPALFNLAFNKFLSPVSRHSTLR